MLVLGVVVCTLTLAAILFALTNTSVPCQVAFFPNPSLHNPYSAAILSEAKEQTGYFIVLNQSICISPLGVNQVQPFVSKCQKLPQKVKLVYSLTKS